MGLVAHALDMDFVLQMLAAGPSLLNMVRTRIYNIVTLLSTLQAHLSAIGGWLMQFRNISFA